MATSCWRARPTGSTSAATLYVGEGQRTLATDAGEYPLLDVRSITFERRLSGQGAPWPS